MEVIEMLEFLEANWSLLVLGAVFVLPMILMHAGMHGGHGGAGEASRASAASGASRASGGCCGGHSQGARQDDTTDNTAVIEGKDRSEQERLAIAVGGTSTESTVNRNGRHAGNCH